MKITAITAQVKSQDRYSIFVDQKFSFSLSSVALAEAGLSVGQALTKPEYTRLKKLAQEDKLYSSALRLVANRPKSHWEVEFYLKRKQASEGTINKILNKLSKLGLINDLNFAESFVSNYRQLHDASNRKITSLLKSKRIPQEYIDKALANNQVDQVELIKSIIIKKRTQNKYQEKIKLMQYLARQGFNYDDIKAAFLNQTDH